MIHTLFTPSLTPVANCHKSDRLRSGHVWPFPESVVSPTASPVTSVHASRVSIIFMSPCAVLKCFSSARVAHGTTKKVCHSFSHWADGRTRAHRRANAHGRRHLSMGGRICVVSTQRDTKTSCISDVAAAVLLASNKVHKVERLRACTPAFKKGQ